jgi:hypothetical protein
MGFNKNFGFKNKAYGRGASLLRLPDNFARIIIAHFYDKRDAGNLLLIGHALYVIGTNGILSFGIRLFHCLLFT